MVKKKTKYETTCESEIFCTICSDWFGYLGGEVIPPDVLAEVSACGHKLPAGEIRTLITERVFDVDVPEGVSEPEPELDFELTEEEQAQLEAMKSALGSK